MIVVGTAIAWILAWECAHRLFSHLDEFRASATESPILRGKAPTDFFIIASVVGGMVALVGISLATPVFRTINN